MKLSRGPALLALLVAATLTLTACVTPPSDSATGVNGNGSCTATGTIPTVPGWSAAQQAEAQTNAQAIAAAVAEEGQPQRAADIATVVALTEATLRNIGFGDIQNGTMTTSRGLFQQLAAWVDPSVTPDPRLDPKLATKMFLNGGFRGQKGLLDVPGWQTMPIPTAAQTVEQSEFDGIRHPFAANYSANLELGLSIAAAVAKTAPTCSGAGGGSVLADGVNVTLPNNEFVVPVELKGKAIQAPNAAVAKGIAAGLGQLGLPYVWGGGGDGAPANNGCARGGGQLNSCGSEIGFDCSGLTAFVLKQAGFPSPGGESTTQRSGGQSIPYSEGLAGDIVGFPGHVAIFLGNINGKPYILEASDVGIPVHVVELRRSDKDPVLHRYWTNSPA